MSILICMTLACEKSTQDILDTSPDGVKSWMNIPAVYKKIYGAKDIYVEGSFLVIKTTGLPDHKSPYYSGTAWASLKAEPYNGMNESFSLDLSRIAENDILYKIPLWPRVASTHVATPLTAMGVAINGVSFYNQFATANILLTTEVNGFDQYGGHPSQDGIYHYHKEPTYLTATKGKDALMGFMLDGFPIYGPLENNKTVTNSDLDAYHGHIGVTADYPNGTYHYHITATAPYINSNGYYGTPGTVAKY